MSSFGGRQSRALDKTIRNEPQPCNRQFSHTWLEERRLRARVVEDNDDLLQQLREVGEDGDGSDVTVSGAGGLDQANLGERGVDAGGQVVVDGRRLVERGGEPVDDVQTAEDAVQTVLGVVLDVVQLVVERSRLVARLFRAQQVYEHGYARQTRRHVRHSRRQLYTVDETRID